MIEKWLVGEFIHCRISCTFSDVEIVNHLICLPDSRPLRKEEKMSLILPLEQEEGTQTRFILRLSPTNYHLQITWLPNHIPDLTCYEWMLWEIKK